MFDTILQTMLPLIVDAVITALLPTLVLIYYRITKIQLEKDARERLHSALKTGAMIALDASSTNDQKIAAMIAYAKRSVPDAINVLNPAIDVLQELALSKLNETVQKL